MNQFTNKNKNITVERTGETNYFDLTSLGRDSDVLTVELQ